MSVEIYFGKACTGKVCVGGLDPSDVDIIMGWREKTRGIKSVEFACMSRVFSIM